MEGMGFESFSRDLLRRFGGHAGDTPDTTATGGCGESDEIELSLGLSLGGCFGEEGKGKKLVRSSSIASFSPWPAKEQQDFPVVAASVLMRTSSLPTETEEERRKRKELQSLKRLEAKRKRLERRNSMKAATKGGEKSDEEIKDGGAGKSLSASLMLSHGGLPAWMPPSRKPPSRAGDSATSGGFPPISQSSVGSQGSSSAGALPEFSKRATQGFTSSNFNGYTESSNLPVLTVCDHKGNNKAPINSLASSVVGKAGKTVGGEDDAPKNGARVNGVNNIEKNMMDEMPCVSTRGEGPNGRKIEGFLYKYKKGEEVRIVCVCHGNFFTPAEFVKHAGGGDVVHPLRHIVVSPAPSVV